MLTGIKPTGSPHLGNLVGAVVPTVSMAKTAEVSYIFIADLHALNTIKDAEKIATFTREMVATLLAMGLDTSRTIVFRQSDVSEIYQLAILLTNITPKGLINRAHSYKSATHQNQLNNLDPDAGINMGLFVYPILMAADILLYQADAVPVGVDQKQHVEFARDIAGYFNSTYKTDTLVLPEPMMGSAERYRVSTGGK